MFISGGMEHRPTLHLLYSRFWNQFCLTRDWFRRCRTLHDAKTFMELYMRSRRREMSKSRGNVVDPQIVVKKFGADTLRMYELFLGPHEAQVSWG